MQSAMQTFALLRHETDIRSFKQGETIFNEGESGNCMFAVLDCRLAAIDEKRFLRLVELTPRFALQMMQLITERLRRTGAH